MNAFTENIDEIHKMGSEPSKYGENIGKKSGNMGEMYAYVENIDKMHSHKPFNHKNYILLHDRLRR